MKKMDLRVLSIQSHVVHGYCGNKCATFPLQLHGFEVDAINSVQFSNHTAYDCWKGPVLSDSELWEIYEGLKQNRINRYTHMLTGYARSEAILKRIADIVKDLRSENKSLFYICDPVMGDNGEYYVPESVMPVYRDVVIPLANVITPNQFELQVLSGLEIHSERQLVNALHVLHGRGTKTIVVTSSNLSPKDDVMYGYGSETLGEQVQTFRFEIPRFPAIFFGTGDLFASLLLIWLQKTDNLTIAVDNTLSSIHDVLSKTFKHAHESTGGDRPRSDLLELRLIQSSKEILEPNSHVKIVHI